MLIKIKLNFILTLCTTRFYVVNIFWFENFVDKYQ